jgi:CubicO group peptidase (beta-lactamase class C family)
MAGITFRRGSARTRLVALAAVLAVVAGPSMSSADDIDDALAPLTGVAGEATGPKQEGDPGEWPEPEHRNDTPHARATRTVATLKFTLGETDLRPSLRPVLAAAEAALAELDNGETSMARFTQLATTAVGEAQRATPEDREAADSLTVARTQLTAAGETVARGLIATAERGGVERTIIAGAQQSVADGVAAVAAGDHAGGAAHFEGATSSIAGSIEFDIKTFYDNLVESFGDQATGIQFAIHDKGAFYDDYANGWNRNYKESPTTAMSTLKDQLTASVSKMITATAVMQLLVQRGLDPRTTKIADFLPPYWNLDAIQDVTFAHVLQHRSGLHFNNSYCCPTWFDTRFDATVGPFDIKDPDDSSKRAYSYQNVNYSLLAATFPRLHPESQLAVELALPLVELFYGTGFFGGADDWYELQAANVYQNVVTTNILQPAGISGSCSPVGQYPTKYYDFTKPDEAGVNLWLKGIKCAYGGWNLSTTDLVKFMSKLRYDNAFLPIGARNLMRVEFLGWNDPTWDWVDGKHGTYYAHGGDFGGSEGMDACIMAFPNGVDVAVLTNSVGGSYGGYQCQAITDDFDTAWVKKS